MDAIARGALAGAAATLPMSAVMLAAGELGLMGEQPPERITERLLHAVSIHPGEGESNLAGTAAHLAFGATMGAAFQLLRENVELPGSPVAQGVAWGLGLWALNYAGWIPALGILPPPDRDRPGRVRTMIAAHVVFGAALGALSDHHPAAAPLG
jgi:hypothetical protein